jgi:hypothetical protein
MRLKLDRCERNGMKNFIFLIIIIIFLFLALEPISAQSNSLEELCDVDVYCLNKTQIKNIIEYQYGNIRVYFDDTIYVGTNFSNWEIALLSSTPNIAWSKYEFDCEDFCYYTVSQVEFNYRYTSVGVAIVNHNHAVVIFESEGEMHIFDPITKDFDTDWYNVSSILFY